jgi:hypothetical protein
VINLHGSATFGVVTAVIVELTIPWVVAPVLRNKFEKLPEDCTVIPPHSYPAEEGSRLYRSASDYGLDNPASKFCRSIENILYDKHQKGLWVQQTPNSRILDLMPPYQMCVVCNIE